MGISVALIKTIIFLYDQIKDCRSFKDSQTHMFGFKSRNEANLKKKKIGFHAFVENTENQGEGLDSGNRQLFNRDL